MIPSLRKAFNDQFDPATYQQLLASIEQEYQEVLFKVCETPVFLPAELKQRLLLEAERIIDAVQQLDLKDLTQNAIPKPYFIPGESDHPEFLVIDFGICREENGELAPKLIELQGFPSLFFWQQYISEKYREFYNFPESGSVYMSDFDHAGYLEYLRKLIIGSHDPKEVILMDYSPEFQKTNIDFYITARQLGLKILCVTQIREEGSRLYYLEGDKKIFIRRIYNRLIFDEIQDMDISFVDFGKGFDVEWVTHPNWYYRISKYILPFLNLPCVPETRFLSDLDNIPEDLEKFVVKPLFSFAGQGVIIDPTREDIERIVDRQNWIIQRKVSYADVIQTLDQPAKLEVRLLYCWPEGEERPRPMINLCRLSKAKMISTRANKNFNWVGGSIGFFFPQDPV